METFDAIINYINEIFISINGVLWGWPMIILLLGTHIFLTLILKFPQRKIFKAIKLSISRDKGATGDVLLTFRGEYTRFENPEDTRLEQRPTQGGEGEILGSKINGSVTSVNSSDVYNPFADSPLPPPSAGSAPF